VLEKGGSLKRSPLLKRRGILKEDAPKSLKIEEAFLGLEELELEPINRQIKIQNGKELKIRILLHLEV